MIIPIVPQVPILYYVRFLIIVIVIRFSFIPGIILGCATNLNPLMDFGRTNVLGIDAKVWYDFINSWDDGYNLFWVWFEQISSWWLPEELRKELLEIKRNARLGEEKSMISNMGRNLQRYYDEAILKGKKKVSGKA
jgi:hypothetical protein